MYWKSGFASGIKGRMSRPRLAFKNHADMHLVNKSTPEKINRYVFIIYISSLWGPLSGVSSRHRKSYEIYNFV